MLDEPTAVLTAQEVRELIGVLDRLKQDGTAIVFISHKLGEVLEVADRITVLRRGKKVDTVPREGATELSLARLVVGRDVLLAVEKTPAQAGSGRCSTVRGPARARRPRARGGLRAVAVGARAARSSRSRASTATASRSWSTRSPGMRAPGVGRGRRSTARTSPAKGVRAATEAGVAHIAEDRQLRGLVLPFTLAENLALREYRRPEFSARGWLRLQLHGANAPRSC